MTDTTRVTRFYPLDVATANSILHKPGTFTVRYYDVNWRVRELEVVAVDEVGAFAAATTILKSMRGWSLSDFVPSITMAVVTSLIWFALGFWLGLTIRGN